MKKIEDVLTKLFDYQKFEDNPKLNQTIKDSKLSAYPFITDKELVAVSGGANGQVVTKCPSCGNNTLIHTTFDGAKFAFCSCGFYLNDDNNDFSPKK